MKKYFAFVFICVFVAIYYSSKSKDFSSPTGNIVAKVFTTENGQLAYTISHKGSTVIDTSFISFDFKDAPSLAENLSIVNTIKNESNSVWEQPWGEDRLVTDHYVEQVFTVNETVAPNRSFDLQFKLYDDGVGFRVHLKGEGEITILDENTQFQLTDNHEVWWIPGDWDIYEHLYKHTKLSEIDAIALQNHNNLAQTYIPENAVNTPVTMRTSEGLHLSFHEANLTNYAGMTLKVDTKSNLLTSELVGREDGAKVQRTLPFSTPWRTIQITETAGELIESKLILNLNEPNVLGDVSWFKPTKYVGIWWEMHLGKSTWDKSSGKHGATTENAKAFIDFAAKNNIGGVLVEGWNTGWEHWIGFEDREGVFDFVTSYTDYDLPEVVRYGKENGVDLIMHHETSAAPRTYEQQLDTAYALMQSLGIHSVKTGYVGKIIPKGEYHHGQWMVNHYRKALTTAAKYQVAINAHEPIKATGIRRTYPNAISREGLRGQEFNAWASDGGNPPSHLPTVAFTRMLAGPIDYTPGIFNIKLDPYKPDNQVNTTIAQQLALYVVIYSPIQMAADLIEFYEGQPGLQFIRDVAVDWEESHVLNGEVGEFVTIARKERGGENWFVGGITNEKPRTIDIDFSYLDAGKTYSARIYKDGENAHWDKNPTALAIEEIEVTSASKLSLDLAAGGGFAISLLINE
jgi:hypothetical protein